MSKNRVKFYSAVLIGGLILAIGFWLRAAVVFLVSETRTEEANAAASCKIVWAEHSSANTYRHNLDCSASPTEINYYTFVRGYNDSTNTLDINWNAAPYGAKNCSASLGWSGPKATSGQETVSFSPSLSLGNLYELDCDKASGNAAQYLDPDASARSDATILYLGDNDADYLTDVVLSNVTTTQSANKPGYYSVSGVVSYSVSGVCGNVTTWREFDVYVDGGLQYQSSLMQDFGSYTDSDKFTSGFIPLATGNHTLSVKIGAAGEHFSIVQKKYDSGKFQSGAPTDWSHLANDVQLTTAASDRIERDAAFEILPSGTSTAPWADIKADSSDGPVTIQKGDSVILSWKSQNVDFCSVNPGGYFGTQNNGVDSGAINSDTTYKLSCGGSNGSSSDEVSVNIQQGPGISFYSLPSMINRGGSSKLVWDVEGADSCAGTSAPQDATWDGGKDSSPGQHSQIVSPTSTTVYTLTCTGGVPKPVTDSASARVRVIFIEEINP